MSLQALLEKSTDDSFFWRLRQYLNNVKSLSPEDKDKIKLFLKNSEHETLKKLLVHVLNDQALWWKKWDPEKAFQYYQEKAQQDDVLAQVALGLEYEKKENNVEAIECYKAASQKGSVLAMYRLAEYYSGIDKEETQKEALKYYQEAAKIGYASAQEKLSILYATANKATPVDFSLSLYWLKKAAKQGHISSQERLAAVYDKGMVLNSGGKEPVIIHDEKQALFWYNSAIKQGASPEKFFALLKKYAAKKGWIDNKIREDQLLMAALSVNALSDDKLSALIPKWVMAVKHQQATALKADLDPFPVVSRVRQQQATSPKTDVTSPVISHGNRQPANLLKTDLSPKNSPRIEPRKKLNR